MDMIHATSASRARIRRVRGPVLRWAVFAATFWLAGAGTGSALEEFCLLIEPKDGPAVQQLLKGAKMTALVPGRETRLGGVRYYTEAEFATLGLGWKDFTRKAEATAARVLATLKPEVTKDFAARVGHPFASNYEARLNIDVYVSLLDLVERTSRELFDLQPRDRIDIQSFIWVVGDYQEDRDGTYT